MPSRIFNDTIITANKVLRSPKILPSILARLIASMVYIQESAPTNQRQDEWSETTYFFVNATDAKDKIPDHNDISFAVSMVLQALTAPVSTEYDEEKQFFADFGRLSAVLDNGNISTLKTPEAALTKWCLELSSATQVPEANIRAAICILNQSIGNGALNFLYNLSGSKHGKIVAYRSLLQSSIMKSILKRDASSLSMSYTIPLQAIDPSTEEDLESFNIEKPDIVVRSELTIKFDEYYCYLDEDLETLTYINADAITHTTTVQRLNREITFNFNRYKQYTNREVDGFILVGPDEFVMPDQKDNMYPKAKSSLV